MAVPKNKTSKSRRDKRRASNVNVIVPNLSKCPKCGELKLSHRVCKACGAYKGRVVLDEKDAG